MPVLLTRANDGEVRAFVNMCSHRGAIVVDEGLRHGAALQLPVPRLDLRPEGRARRHPQPGGLRRRRRVVPRADAAPGRRAGRPGVRGAHPGRRGRHRRVPLRLRRPARPLPLRRVAPGGPAQDRGAELEGRLRRLPRLLPPADPAQEQLRAQLPEPGHLRQLGTAPAGERPEPEAARPRGHAGGRVGRSTGCSAGCGRSSPTSPSPRFEAGRPRCADLPALPGRRRRRLGHHPVVLPRPRARRRGARSWPRSRPTSSSTSCATRTTTPACGSSGR